MELETSKAFKGKVGGGRRRLRASRCTAPQPFLTEGQRSAQPWPQSHGLAMALDVGHDLLPCPPSACQPLGVASATSVQNLPVQVAHCVPGMVPSRKQENTNNGGDMGGTGGKWRGMGEHWGDMGGNGVKWGNHGGGWWGTVLEVTKLGET